MVEEDLYDVFGVKKDVLEVEIKWVYWKLVVKYYLDVNYELGVEKKFKKINEVYEILSDD